jgi:hypothetical protein
VLAHCGVPAFRQHHLQRTLNVEQEGFQRASNVGGIATAREARRLRDEAGLTYERNCEDGGAAVSDCEAPIIASAPPPPETSATSVLGGLLAFAADYGHGMMLWLCQAGVVLWWIPWLAFALASAATMNITDAITAAGGRHRPGEPLSGSVEPSPSQPGQRIGFEDLLGAALHQLAEVEEREANPPATEPRKETGPPARLNPDGPGRHAWS